MIAETTIVRSATPVALRGAAGDGLRGAAGDGLMPTLVGYFAVMNSWAEIDSWTEGHFMERFAPGAFHRTLADQATLIRCLFQHGCDPQVGDKPLGSPSVLEEDATGARFEVPLLDTRYCHELVPGLAAGVYGASFRFRVLREEVRPDPGVSTFNPKGLSERTIREVEIREFGPVTWPAYIDATAGVRSLTDWYRDELGAS